MRTPEGVLAWASCLLTVVLGVVALFVLPPMETEATGFPADVHRAISAMGAVPYALVGALITWHRPRNRIGWLMVGLGITANLAVVGAGYARALLPASDAADLVGALAWSTGMMLVTLLIQLFPTGRPLSARWRPLVWMTVLWLPAVAFVASSTAQDAAQLAVVVSLALLGLGAVVSAFLRFARSRGDERQQLKWFAYAAAVFFVLAGLGLTGALGRDWSPPVGTAAFYVLPVGVAVAILRHRLYDIDVLISRTFVYGTLVAILAGLYTASITLFKSLFVAATGEESDAWIVITTLVLATSFTPIKRHLEAVVERRFKEPDETTAPATAGTAQGADVLTELRDLSERLARVESLLAARPVGPPGPKPGQARLK
jgi:hypothetical protein